MASPTTTTTTPVNHTFTELTDLVLPPPLSTLDYSDPAVKLTIVLAQAMISLVIYITTYVIFTSLLPLYRELPSKEKNTWNLNAVRSCFGVFGTVVGIWAIFGQTKLKGDLVRATSPTSHMAMSVAAGSFAFECLVLTLSDVYFGSFSVLLQAHHWISLAGFVSALVTNACHGFACLALMLEMIMPFSSLSWMLLQSGKEHTFLWKVNQLLLVHAYHLRNVVEMMAWCLAYQQRDNVWTHMPWGLLLTMLLLMTLLTFVMTPYWTLLVTRRMVRVFRGENVRAMKGLGSCEYYQESCAASPVAAGASRDINENDTGKIKEN